MGPGSPGRTFGGARRWNAGAMWICGSVDLWIRCGLGNQWISAEIFGMDQNVGMDQNFRRKAANVHHEFPP